MCIHMRTRVPQHYLLGAQECILYSAWASRCCSKLTGNARASIRGTTAVGYHVFFMHITQLYNVNYAY